MLPVGALVWVSIRPLLRLVICATTGFLITKADIFPQVAARGAGQIMLNITIPSLMFSKIVPAFTPQNIGALGPLILVAALYQMLGIASAWIVKQFFWVPHRFRYGILVAGGWGNWGDVPTAVIMSITGSAPFNGSTDQSLSVAYISAFILVFFVSLFPMGGHRLVALDYVGPEVEDDDIRMPVKAKALGTIHTWIGVARSVYTVLANKPPKPLRDPEVPPITAKSMEENRGIAKEDVADVSLRHRPEIGSKHVSFYVEDSTAIQTEIISSGVGSPAPTEALHSMSRVTSASPTAAQIDSTIEILRVPQRAGQSVIASSKSRGFLRGTINQLHTLVKSLITPPAIAIISAIIIAIVQPLKALFVSIPTVYIPNAPDGQPPLAFILDSATFIGNASVPLGLICLGSAMARLKVPWNQWSRLPVGAIAWLAISKMIVIPVIGVLICQGLVNAGVIDREDKVLRFVCIFFSCVPTATTQVFLTQVYSGTGSAEHLSAFLIPQYAIMFISMTTLTAFTLRLLF
ncbi:hypothetical protein BD410DRAFT_748622 [Rickenella mellea]|uniref:Auxin efflux carrier n=1 Tax=Rickenella mellea TaxID=50990 RepID=A0A4Y7Q4R5_9AGAM|nr:hypothetical protein BD410DRAFT_748622 [Rickenella mellea]